MDRGYCVNMISGKDYEINDENKLYNKTWWETRPSNIQMPASTWVALKKYIIQTCKKTNMCDAEVTSWDRAINNIETHLEENR